MAGVPEHLARTILDLVKRYLRDEYKIDLSHQVRGTLPTDYGGTGSSSGAMGPPGPTGPPGPAGPPGLAGPLDTLTDVTIASPVAGQVLRKSGGDWVNAQLAFADLGTRPTTLAGYGITDAVTLGTAQTIAGVKTFSAAPVFPMTPGSVLFAGAGGVVTENNAQLFWDDANRRLGLGTAAPAEKLHIVSDTAAILSFDAYGASSLQRLQFRRGFGTAASPLPVDQGGTVIAGYSGYAYASSGFQIGGALSLSLDGAPAGDDVPTRWSLFLHRLGAGPGTTEVLRVANSGRLGLGDVVTPTSRLHVVESDAAVTTVTPVVTIAHNSTGVPGAGFGSSVLFLLESSASNNRTVADLTVTWATATDASRKARLAWNVYDQGSVARPALIMESSGSAGMIAFLGAPAAPRQTLPAAATDPATTQALANAIRNALLTFGLGA